ncbi:hypothetical protein DERP_000453 [Dermatophagoides pteronyssinus]|uniref:Uncharacterized protein n=1 Tax=Dermatophagoides pteronyssinus TaxID=6956 RepID=A0ABQ8J077_DERPT|nr:hypothetical protein DERP_000453 [Dermatophagoides pteronyssinus]
MYVVGFDINQQAMIIRLNQDELFERRKKISPMIASCLCSVSQPASGFLFLQPKKKLEYSIRKFITFTNFYFFYLLSTLGIDDDNNDDDDDDQAQE